MIELLLCAALAGFLAARAELRELAGRLDAGRRVFLGALLVLIPLGHLGDAGKRSFPFVPWNMYVKRASGDPVFLRYRLHHASGIQEDLSGWGVDRPLSPQLHHRLQSLSGAGEYPVALGGADADAALDATLRGLARARARDVPNDPPVAVEIWRATVPLQDPQNPTAVRLELLRTIALP